MVNFSIIRKFHAHEAGIEASVCARKLRRPVCLRLGMEVDLGPGYIMLDGAQLLRKGHSSPLPSFGQCLLWEFVVKRSPISAAAELLCRCAHGRRKISDIF